MTNVISLLERIGQDADLRGADREALERAIAALDPELRQALLARDQAALERLLGARTNVICGLVPGKDDEEEEDEDDDRRDDDEIRSLSACLRA